jgi:hypothetical protein
VWSPRQEPRAAEGMGRGVRCIVESWVGDCGGAGVSEVVKGREAPTENFSFPCCSQLGGTTHLPHQKSKYGAAASKARLASNACQTRGRARSAHWCSTWHGALDVRLEVLERDGHRAAESTVEELAHVMIG